MTNKIDKNLNLLIGVVLGGFVGYSIYKYYHYLTYPKMYQAQSAPWYTGLQIYGVLTLTVVLIAIVAKLIIKKKMGR